MVSGWLCKTNPLRVSHTYSEGQKKLFFFFCPSVNKQKWNMKLVSRMISFHRDEVVSDLMRLKITIVKLFLAKEYQG